MKLINELRNPPELKTFKQHIAKQTNIADNKVSHYNHTTSWGHPLDKLFAEHGFTWVGNGAFGTVYQNPNYPYVIKVFQRDTAYLMFMNWAIRNQNNKYLPKFKGKVITLSPLFFAVRVEKLLGPSTYRPHEYHTQFLDMCRNPEDYLDNHSEYTHIPPAPNDPDALAICKFLIENKKLADIASTNIMIRADGTPVLIDPLFNFIRGGQFAISPDDISNFKELFR